MTTESEKQGKRPLVIRAFVFAAILVALFVCAGLFQWDSYFSAEGDFFTQLDALVDDNLMIASLIYIAAMIVCCVLLALLGVVFAIIAGTLFGAYWGTALCVIAATLGAVASFIAGRYFLRDLIAPRLAKNKLLKRWLFDEQGQRQLIVLMVTRLVPVFPYNLQNFAYGVTSIKLSTYTWGTFFFLIPGTAVYTFAAAGVVHAENRWIDLTIAALLFAAVTLLGIYLRKRFLSQHESDSLEEVRSSGTSKVEGQMEVRHEESRQLGQSHDLGRKTMPRQSSLPEAHSQVEQNEQRDQNSQKKERGHLEQRSQLEQCNWLMEDDAKRCIHCHICQEGCVFLSKYAIDIGDIDSLDEHKQGCFLCGRCTRRCPVGIDGQAVVLAMRQRESLQKGSFKSLLGAGAYPLEKWHYPFKNYRHARPVSFFPGCSLFSSYPKTTAALAAALAEKDDIGVVYDCCGSPLHQSGLVKSTDDVLKRLVNRLERHGVQELLVACPHCFELLEGRIPQKVSGIYEKLGELGLEIPVSKDMRLFPPCPDRGSLRWFDAISSAVGSEVEKIAGPQCCGFGGGASVHESELSKGLATSIIDDGGSHVFVYCASCGNALGRHDGGSTRHVLSLIMGIDEPADVAGSFRNRMKSKFL